jgi:hypothetical protein
LYAIEHVDEGQGIDASEVADGEYKDDAAQSQPSDPDWSHTSTIFDVAAFPLSLPTHEDLLTGRGVSSRRIRPALSLNEFVGFSNGAVHVSDRLIDLGVDFHPLSYNGGQRAHCAFRFARAW